MVVQLPTRIAQEEFDGRHEQRLARIVWVDSGLSFASTWLEHSTIVERAMEWTGKIVSVGRVVYEDNERVVLGISYDQENDNWASVFLIAKQSILTRESLLPHDA